MIGNQAPLARLLAIAMFSMLLLPAESAAQSATTDPRKPPALSYIAETVINQEMWNRTKLTEKEPELAQKIFYAPGLQRRETREGGDLSVVIIDVAAKKRFDFNLTTKTYYEGTVEYPSESLALVPKIVIEAYDFAGRETVNGIAAEKWKLSGGMPASRTVLTAKGYLWIAQGNIPVKMEVEIGSPEPDKEPVRVRLVVETRKLTVGPVDPTLFALPADYKLGR